MAKSKNNVLSQRFIPFISGESAINKCFKFVKYQVGNREGGKDRTLIVTLIFAFEGRAK